MKNVSGENMVGVLKLGGESGISPCFYFKICWLILDTVDGWKKSGFHSPVELDIGYLYTIIYRVS